MTIKKMGLVQLERSEATVGSSRGGLTLTLPREVSDYLKIKDGSKIFWTPIDGTIQISTMQGMTSIPVIGDTVDFIPQPEDSESAN